jgi:hypothetical protein
LLDERVLAGKQLVWGRTKNDLTGERGFQAGLPNRPLISRHLRFAVGPEQQGKFPLGEA